MSSSESSPEDLAAQLAALQLENLKQKLELAEAKQEVAEAKAKAAEARAQLLEERTAESATSGGARSRTSSCSTEPDQDNDGRDDSWDQAAIARAIAASLTPNSRKPSQVVKPPQVQAPVQALSPTVFLQASPSLQTMYSQMIEPQLVSFGGFGGVGGLGIDFGSVSNAAGGTRYRGRGRPRESDYTASGRLRR